MKKVRIAIADYRALAALRYRIRFLLVRRRLPRHDAWGSNRSNIRYCLWCGASRKAQKIVEAYVAVAHALDQMIADPAGIAASFLSAALLPENQAAQLVA
jgi:hypothetical protein